MNNLVTKHAIYVAIGIALIGIGVLVGISIATKKSPIKITDRVPMQTPQTAELAGSTSPVAMIPGTPIPCPPGGIPCIMPEPVQIMNLVPPPSISSQALILSGQATTTVSGIAPRNDLFIGDSQAYLDSTPHYRFMPYPGDVAIKSAYIILPDFYSIPDQGYKSDPYLRSADGTKNIILHLHHQNNVSTDTDAVLMIQSPIPTTDPDHPMTLVEETTLSSAFSLVQNGKEVIVEITYTPKGILTESEALYARNKLNESIFNARINW